MFKSKKGIDEIVPSSYGQALIEFEILYTPKIYINFQTLLSGGQDLIVSKCRGYYKTGTQNICGH